MCLNHTSAFSQFSQNLLNILQGFSHPAPAEYISESIHMVLHIMEQALLLVIYLPESQIIAFQHFYLHLQYPVFFICPVFYSIYPK